MSVAEGAKDNGLAKLSVYFKPRIANMLLLGFSSGLPFFLTGNTLGYWLRDEGTSLTAIGFISWVGLAYTLKPLWAPIIDRVDAPIFGRLGRRRGWMLVAQIFVFLGLTAMSLIGPQSGLLMLGACAVVVAFASSTQDIVIDAWRIEVAADTEELGVLTSSYQLGYRAAVMISDSVILIAAEHLGWPISYGLMAALMLIGIVAALKATEPRRADEVMTAKTTDLPLWTPRGFFDAVVGPFLIFFRTHGWMALLMLAMICLYRLPDFIRAPLISPFYPDVGLNKDVVGSVRATVGFASTLLGIAAAGLSAARFGSMKTLIIGSVLQSVGISAFAVLAFYGADILRFGSVMALDDFSIAFAGVALTVYMSSLTSLGYTATQYALLSSAYALLGKILKGPSGLVVDYLSHHGHTLMESYGMFFIGSGLVGAPALVLCVVLARLQSQATRPQLA
ncbi:MAG TPA: MFS transporter [Micropepsaceae bacterium]|nr:MFS transporter [Micropepsaceae bacterium]